jgi:hypothetical protein
MNFPCPCCGYLTYTGSPPTGDYHICPVCYWEDDPVQAAKPDLAGGANHVSLNQARVNFRRFRASSPDQRGNVREPLPEELPPD